MARMTTGLRGEVYPQITQITQIIGSLVPDPVEVAGDEKVQH